MKSKLYTMCGEYWQQLEKKRGVETLKMISLKHKNTLFKININFLYLAIWSYVNFIWLSLNFLELSRQLKSFVQNDFTKWTPHVWVKYGSR